MSDLAKLISEVVKDLPESLLYNLVADLADAKTFSAASRVVGNLPSNTQRKFGQVLSLAKRQSLTMPTLALALDAAFQTHNDWRTSHSVEMVWTGPSPASSKLRRTDQALLQIIDSAQEMLWIVSFAAYRVNDILTSLKKALERGVRVGLILESSEESEGKLSTDQIREIQNELGTACKFYVWPTEKREANEYGRRGLLHAKCAIADGRHILVSSANLTEAAMRRNIELGVLIESERYSSQVEEHIQWLIESDILERLV